MPLKRSKEDEANLRAFLNEIRPINKIIDSELYTEEEANESLVYSKKNPKIIHFASHSFYFDKKAIKGHSMQRSGIVLAGANNFYKNKIAISLYKEVNLV